MSKKADHFDPKAEIRVTDLLAQKMKLLRKVILIDLAINRIVLSGGRDLCEDVKTKVTQVPAPHDPCGDNRNEKTLDFYVYDILMSSQLTFKDLVAEILRSGYKTASKNFPTVVQQVIQRLSKSQAIKKNAETRKYSGVRMSADTLRQRLSQLNKNKRKSRSERVEG
jgi:hypothetical protein